MRCLTTVVLVLIFNTHLIGQQARERTRTTEAGSYDTAADSGATTGRQSGVSQSGSAQSDSAQSASAQSGSAQSGFVRQSTGRRSSSNAGTRASDLPSIQSTDVDSGLTRPNSATQVSSPKKVSVDFPGGTIADYVDAIKKEADTLNLIVTESAKDLTLPKIALKNVPTHVAIKCIEQCFDSNKTIVRVSGEIEGVQFIQAEVISTNQVEVINIRHLISGKRDEKENFLAAVETGLQMQNEAGTNLKIKFHEETGLLFLAGDRTEIDLVQQIVSELSPQHRGGMGSGTGMMMESGMGGGGASMMGSGGAGMGPGMGPGRGSGLGGSGGTGLGSGGMMPGSGGSSRRSGAGGASGRNRRNTDGTSGGGQPGGAFGSSSGFGGTEGGSPSKKDRGQGASGFGSGDSGFDAGRGSGSTSPYKKTTPRKKNSSDRQGFENGGAGGSSSGIFLPGGAAGEDAGLGSGPGSTTDSRKSSEAANAFGSAFEDELSSAKDSSYNGESASDRSLKSGKSQD